MTPISDPEPQPSTTAVVQVPPATATPLSALQPVRVSGELLFVTDLLFCGAIAGMTGRLATAPLDRVRILYQVSSDRKFTFSSAVKTFTTIARNSGIAGLWRGNGAAMLRIAPTSALSFTMFERYNKFLVLAVTLSRATLLIHPPLAMSALLFQTTRFC